MKKMFPVVVAMAIAMFSAVAVAQNAAPAPAAIQVGQTVEPSAIFDSVEMLAQP